MQQEIDPPIETRKVNKRSIKEIKKIELSPETIIERQFLSGLLIQNTEDLVKEAKERKKKLEQEIIELNNGVKISISEINAIVSAQRQPYSPKFPNDVPFFKEIYRLNQWNDLNPNDYYKPPIVGNWINEIIYGRFIKDVLPAIQVLNPPILFGIRLHKNFQFLTKEGQNHLIQFRDEAIEVMQSCATWHEFRVKYSQQYGIPFQGNLFEKNTN